MGLYLAVYRDKQMKLGCDELKKVGLLFLISIMITLSGCYTKDTNTNHELISNYEKSVVTLLR